jgi:co-chaperonin GroES (HSP10)
MKVRLLQDLILVKLDQPPKQKVVDGTTIYYPEGSHASSTEIQCWATVEAVGPGKWATKKGRPTAKRVPNEVKPGDRVMMTWYLSQVESNKALANILGDGRVIIRPEDVLCVEPAQATSQPAA